MVRSKLEKCYSLTCIDYPRCWGVEPLLIRGSKRCGRCYDKKQSVPLEIADKYVGEMKDEDASCMFDANQWMEVLEWDASVSAQVEALMGKDSQPKKDFVFSRINFEELE